MPRFAQRSVMPAPAEDVFAWHSRDGAFRRLAPPGRRLREVSHTGGIRDGARNEFDLRVGPVWRPWVAVHEGYVEGRQFRDVQQRGPLPRWEHTHRFEPVDDVSSVLSDTIDYDLPLPSVSNWIGAPIAERLLLEPMFAFRHARTRQDLERHRAFPVAPRRVAITGAGGMIGRALGAFLTTGGHRVVNLVRREPTRPGEIAWSPDTGHMDGDALEGVDAVVHLAGEPIAGPWTPRKKRRILESRRDGTRFLAESLARLDDPPEVLVSASGAGFYGDRGGEWLDEGSPRGEGFLSDVTAAWEEATEPARRAGIRVVNLRIGIVLSADGGMLRPLLPMYRSGLGTVLGSGEQYVSWIGLDDLVGVVQRVLVTDVDGPVNAVSPEAVPQRRFAQVVARELGRPLFLRAPAGVLGRLPGGMRELFLDGQRVGPGVLDKVGHRFLTPTLDAAIRWDVLGVDPSPA